MHHLYRIVILFLLAQLLVAFIAEFRELLGLGEQLLGFLSMFEVWMQGVVLCFAQRIRLVNLAVVLWRNKFAEGISNLIFLNFSSSLFSSGLT